MKKRIIIIAMVLYHCLSMAQAKDSTAVSSLSIRDDEPDLSAVYDGLKKFGRERDAAKYMQVVGTLLGGVAVFFYSKSDQNEPEVIRALAIGGSALFTIGLVIDWRAGRHLHFKRR